MTLEKNSNLHLKIEKGGIIMRNKFEVFQKETPVNQKAQRKQLAKTEKAFKNQDKKIQEALDLF